MKALIAIVLASGFSLSAHALTEDAKAAPFVGEWQIAFPDAPGVIVNRPDVSCDAPAQITQVDETHIRVITPGGDMGIWAVKSFAERYPWWRDDGQSLVADWVREDAFLLAGKDRSGIKTDWQNARQWTRCPADKGGDHG